MLPSPVSSLESPFKGGIDCGCYFSDTNKSPGLYVYIISGLEPVYLDSFDGELCIGDCYIILYSKVVDSMLEHVIYTWIGSLAQLDKRFCAAMYAVGLKDLLTGNASIIRIVSEEEPLEFKELFDLKYLDFYHSSESGLFPVGEKDWPLFLYVLNGKFDWNLSLV